MYISN